MASKFKLLWRVILTDRHRPTGFTRHNLPGGLMPLPHELRITQYRGDTGFYLFYCGRTGAEMTDTYHDTVEGAMKQAELEFNVEESDWSAPRGATD